MERFADGAASGLLLAISSRAACGDDIRDFVALVENHGERTGHKARSKFIELVGNILCYVLDLFERGYMHDERIVLRSALCLEYFCDRTLVKGVCAESVHGFRRKHHESALVDYSCALLDCVACFFDCSNHLYVLT